MSFFCIAGLRVTDQSKIADTFFAARTGDRQAAEELLPLLYNELRSLGKAMMKRRPSGETLQATALVHEAYAKVVGSTDPGWDGRGHFFAAAAQAMREVLVDQARRRNALKRGGDRKREELMEFHLGADDSFADILALDEVLAQLEKEYPAKYKVVLLRFFAGLSMQEIAEQLQVSKSTVERDWRFARAWLYKQMDGLNDDQPRS